MTITHDDAEPRHAPMRRPGRLHKLATILTANGLSALALHWAFMRLGERAAFFANWRFADALALVLAASILCAALGLSWRAGRGGSAHR